MYASQKQWNRELGREYSGIPRVVVAEDDEVFRGLLCDLLRECGLRVSEAQNGVELLELLAQSARSDDHGDRIDLIVSDVCVPEYGSIELILGMHAAKMGIPLIAITVFGQRRSHVLAHRPQDITLEEEAFDLEGFREMVLGLLSDRSVPSSIRITLRPPSMPTQRPPGMPAVVGQALGA
jgi:CheY-like chemotaxis protein